MQLYQTNSTQKKFISNAKNEKKKKYRATDKC